MSPRDGAYPRIHLAIDNCFAYKRWTRPEDWARVVRGLGLRYVEASADTELDPLYMGDEYLQRWLAEVREAEAAHGVRVCNLYSGHGTYTTLGLTHPDAGVRARMEGDWFVPMIELAGALRCGLGFFAHGFEHRALQDAATYAAHVELLVESLARLSRRAGEAGCGKLGVEQMYTPHMYPWRLADTEHLLREVTARSGRDFYFTEDVGHHHVKFMRPDRAALARGGVRGVWLGTDRAYELAERLGPAGWDAIAAELDRNPQLFSGADDADCYRWLERLGPYSPIVHLQQTDGRSSGHLPFTAERNRWGKISGEEVLRALRRGYDHPAAAGLPSRCEDVYLTIEVFSATTSIPNDLLADLRESVAYWRRFVPEDGLALDALVDRLASN